MRSLGEQVLAGIALQQEIEHATPAVHRSLRFGFDHHAVSGGRSAGRQQLVLALDRNQADPAVPDDGQLGIPAQRRDIDTHGARRFQNGGAGFEGDGFAVDRQGRHCNRFEVLISRV